MTNNFWKDTLTAFQNIQEKMTIESWQDFISQPLWHNKKFKIDKKAIFYSSWYNKGVRYVSDLFDEHGSFLTLKNFERKFNLNTNFLTYASLQKVLKIAMASEKFDKEMTNPRPFIPFQIKLFCSTKKGTKLMYDILKKETIEPFSKIKWGRHFNITDLQWKKYYNIPFQCTKSSKLQWLQYRINQHILTTKKILFKIGLKDDNLCSFCNNSEETIIHILWECPKVQELLDNFSILCKIKNIEFPKESCTFILGSLSPNSRELNTILLCIKSFIYRSKCCNETLTLQGLLGDIKILLSTLKYNATKNNQLNEFETLWKNWLLLM